ncbi:uncharacterized protein LOC116256105 isoform X2 [Nymphaea colorata]|uniref:uncharacterized protein LOC116256105 isoform X2 n=1 Tax=Nymphaea colorata TaxID=210225 RepID=UPI00214F5F73|nr:uncharacterized protein LOC116256105 isoform X2 [Nymphaea colorata]
MRTQPLDRMPPLLPSSSRPPKMGCSIRVGRRSSCGRRDRLALWMPAVHFPARSPPWSRGSGWGFSSCPSRASASSSSAPKSYATWSKNQVQDEEEEGKRSSCPEGLQTGSLPQHVAVIMDGNSRWARRRGLPVAAGHEAGVRALQEVVRLSCAWGIPILTVFAFSMDNWNRPQAEVDILMRLFQSVLRNEVATLKREGIRLCVVGDKSKLPKSLQKLVGEVVEMTKANHRLKLVVAISYSGRNEIVRACQKLASRVRDGELWPSDITESMFERELDMRLEGGYPDPDLVIRTSGELRGTAFIPNTAETIWQTR